MMGISRTITWGDVEKYQRLRQASRKLTSRITKTIPRAAYEEIGTALGIMRKGVLVFDTEDMAAVLADCCLHDYIRDGQNLIEKYAQEHPAPPGSDEEYLLRAQQQARFRIIIPGSVAPGAGVECTDGLSGERIFLMDVGLSHTARKGKVLFATRTIPLEGYWITTGAGLPIPGRKAGMEVVREAERILKVRPVDHHRLALAILRKCLDNGAAEYVTYAGTEELGDNRESVDDLAEPPQPAISPRRPGRNAPCPCGSGRKYKKCHGRPMT